MLLFKSLMVLTCFFKLNNAQLKSCLKEEVAAKICLKSSEGYLKPFPLNLTTKIELKEIVDIDEDEKSITIQMNLLTRWEDKGIGRSNASDL